MPLPTVNRRQAGARRQQWRRLLLLPLVATVLAQASLALCAPTTPSSSPYQFNVTEALHVASNTWMNPCGTNVQGNVSIVKETSYKNGTKFLNMLDQINLTLLDLNNWRDMSGSNKSVTTWNDTLRKRQFKFLQPFVKNASCWERRLSVYWAYLELVRLFHKNYSETTNINRQESEALDSVNEANRQLLCTVQEYRVVTKRHKKQIDAKHMINMIKFNIQDASELRIHIWYIMCRLDCFLTKMYEHLQQLRVDGKAHSNIDVMSCKRCPYCRNFNKQCKPAKKKQRKQPKRQQQRKHNRAGHNSAQQKQATQQQKQQQRPSRQPKGRKGTRTLNNRARNKQQ